MDPITAVASLVQTGIGVVQTAVANKKLKKLFKQRTAFQTPDEVFDILKASQFRAGMGYDQKTLDFLTDSSDKAFASSVGAATRLGGDPNVIAGLNDRHISEIMKIGSDDAVMKLANFDKFLNAKSLVAQNKEAEWQSKENLIKDQMQAASAQSQAGQKNIESGVNLGISSYAAGKTGDLWKDQLSTLTKQIEDLKNKIGNG